MNKPITLLLSLAFAFVLALLAGVGFYGISSLKVIDERVGLITDLLLKKYTLTMSMREAARERSLNLHRMILMEDAFDRDEEWIEFNHHASDFSLARAELLGMHLTAAERDILAEQDELIKKNVLVQRKVVDLAMLGERESAASLLSEKALPAQNDVFTHIQTLLQFYSKNLQIERQVAANTTRNIIFFGWLLGGMALFIGLLVAIWSIRRISRGQRELLAQEQEQREIINGMMTGVMTIDEQGIIESFNYAATSIFGYRSEDIVGRSINLLMPSASHDHHQQYLTKYFQGEEPGNLMGEREIHAMRSDGTTFPLRIMLSRLPPNRSGKLRVIASCFDITEQKEQEERLRTSQKMDALGKLTGGIAHDYNNMLGVILGYSELLMVKAGSDEKLHAYIRDIVQAAERGSRLTKKLLSFTRRKPMEESVVDINVLLSDDRLMLEKTLTSAIRLTMRLADEPCTVELDVDDLENAILNLCINALHAMPDGGDLKFTTKQVKLDETQAARRKIQPGNYIFLQIEDSGCGMDEDTKNRIFEPFFTTKGDSGTGLGLSQVYGFVKRSGGDVSLTSSPGEGTRFDLLFPCTSLSLSSPMVEPACDTADEVNRQKSILVVDDEPALCEMVAEMLSAEGYRVFTAASGEEALSLLQQQSIDLMLSDVIMPGMNGYQLAQRVKQMFPQVKIQLMSGYSDSVEGKSGEGELSEQMLRKPFHIDDLNARINAVFDKLNV